MPGDVPLMLTLHMDAEPAARQARLLAQAAERSLEVRHRVLGLLQSGRQPFRLDCDWTLASGAYQGRVRLELADGLADLVAAAVARDV